MYWHLLPYTLNVFRLRIQSHIRQANQICILCLLLFDDDWRTVYKTIEAYGLFFSLYNSCVHSRELFLQFKLVLILYPLKSVGFLLLLSEHIAACMKDKCLFKMNISPLSFMISRFYNTVRKWGKVCLWLLGQNSEKVCLFVGFFVSQTSCFMEKKLNLSLFHFPLKCIPIVVQLSHSVGRRPSRVSCKLNFLSN